MFTEISRIFHKYIYIYIIFLCERETKRPGSIKVFILLFFYILHSHNLFVPQTSDTIASEICSQETFLP